MTVMSCDGCVRVTSRLILEWVGQTHCLIWMTPPPPQARENPVARVKICVRAKNSTPSTWCGEYDVVCNVFVGKALFARRFPKVSLKKWRPGHTKNLMTDISSLRNRI